MGLSFFLFGATFFLLILTVVSLVSPDRFPVRLKDRTIRLADLMEEQEKLSGEHATLLAARSTLDERMQAPTLRQVDSLQRVNQPLGAALLAVDEVRKSFDTSGRSVISLPRVSFDAVSGTLLLGGEVRDAQGRSVQLLASFVDGLRALPVIASVTEPEYRVDPIPPQAVSTAVAPSGGTVSPFTLSIKLQRGT
jgi:hypothetical protein